MAPGGLLALYLMGVPASVDVFWTIVLPSAYLCYVVVPFMPTLPPRVIEQEGTLQLHGGILREGNIAVLQYASIGANTFPSAHAAVSIAVALALLQFAPLTGALFMLLAVSINVACVAQRYHYAADAVLGTLVACAVFGVSRIAQ
jgi:hypothetical protein